MNKKFYIGLFFLCLSGLFFWDTTGLAKDLVEQGDKKNKILVVHSYHPEYEWVSTVSRGIKRIFENEENIRLETVYMDTKRKTSQEWKQQVGERVQKVIANWQPDVLITVDDNAQEYVGKYYAGKERPYVVFCGVNRSAERYGYPASNVTGVLERPNFKATIDFLQEIMPEVKKIAVISDHSPTSQGAIKYIKEKAPEVKVKIIAYDLPVTFKEWKACINSYQDKAQAILLYTCHTIKQAQQEDSLASETVMSWTAEHSQIPLVSLLTFIVDNGALCGVLESGLEQGYQAAKMARELLKGKDIKALPIKTPKKGLIMFNNKSARRWNVEIQDEIKEKIDILVGE